MLVLILSNAQPPQPFAIALALLACNYWQEAACHHHHRCARWSLYAAALAYAGTAAKYALGG